MSERLRIDFVSPLPPVRSGIADYSADLLPHLESLCDLRVARLPGQPVAESIDRRWHPVAAASTGTEGRLPVYQMGNNRYHDGVLDLALERPGILTLHDLVLHHLLVESTLGDFKDEHDSYRRRLVADHGWMGELTAQARQWGELGQAALFELAAHRTLLRRQRGVLVHSHWAANKIAESDPDVQVRTVPMGVPLAAVPEPAAALALRQRFGVQPEDILLGSFGFQTPIKRTDRVIEALARPELAEAHLVVAGEIAPVLELEKLAREQGVAERVHFVGFLPYEEFETAISACDLCLNLRYPTAGETSASLLRVLAAGRPALVSDCGPSVDLPAEVALKVPVGRSEVEELAARIGAVLEQPDRLKEMGEAARDYVRRRHDPAAAAAAIVNACRELAGAEPPGDEPPRVDPPSTFLWRQVEGELVVEGADPPWPEGAARQLRIRLTNGGLARWLATGTQVGGVMIELQWRKSPWHPSLGGAWLKLRRDLEPGESRSFEVEVRRPPGSGTLIVEPHIRGAAGFNALGGPFWLQIL